MEKMRYTFVSGNDISLQCGEEDITVPPHFAYPETNMALTCNYFSGNDYTRKLTIQDIKQKVIEERSYRKVQ